MRFIVTDDTSITPETGKEAIKGTQSFTIEQRYTKYKGVVSKEVVDLIDCFRVARTVEAARELLAARGYTFGDIAARKLTNTVNFLVQVGVLVILMDDTEAEFSPIIRTDEKSLRKIDLGDVDTEALVRAASVKDNHPYPGNVLDTKSGNSRPRSRP